MSFIQILFYLFAALAVGAALFMVFTRNLLHAAFSLLLTFLGVAALYVLAGADFVAIVQIMIYVGGVMVLLIFGVMLTSKSTDRYLTSPSYNRWIGILASLGLFGVFLLAIIRANFASASWIVQSTEAQTMQMQSSVQGIGVQLMTDFVLPFEIAGILLLVALIGAAYIAGRKADK